VSQNRLGKKAIDNSRVNELVNSKNGKASKTDRWQQVAPARLTQTISAIDNVQIPGVVVK
jgi:hypothetical protein